MRNGTMLLLATFAATSIAAQPLQDTALKAAVRFVPTVVRGTKTSQTAGLIPSDFAIAEETIACDDAFLTEWLEDRYSHPLVQELLASYRMNGAERPGIHSEETYIPILALDQFSKGDNEYDWEKLRSAFPAVRGIVRMSFPAMDSQRVYAVAHYEVITPKGRAFANFHMIEKQGDGSWRVTTGVTGSLQNAVTRSSAAAARARSAD